MKKYNLFIIPALVVLAVLATSIVACTRTSSKPTFKIGLSQCADDEWRTKMNQEMRRELLFYPNMELTILQADNSTEQQCKDIDSLVNMGIDLLIVSPNEADGVTDAVSRAFDMGIPVIMADRRVNGEKYTAFIGGDNYNVGTMMGQYVAETLPNGGKVVEVMGLDGSTSAILRHKGLMDVLDKYPNIEVVANIKSNWVKKDAQASVAAYLQTNKDVDVIVAHNDVMAIGAYEAAQELGMQDHIQFVGADALSGPGLGVEGIVEGKLDASFAYPTEGDLLIRRAYQILTNQPFPRDTVFPSYYVNKESAIIMQNVSKEVEHEVQTVYMLQEKVTQYWEAYELQNIIIYLISALAVVFISFLIYFIYMYRMQRATNKKLQQATQELEQANASKLAFFTNVSHDFRTPLTLITDPIEKLIHDSNLTVSQQQLLRLAYQNANVLLRLINQILDFRRIESGKMQLDLHEANLSSCLKMWTKSFMQLAQKKHIHLSLQIEPNQDYVCAFDVSKIERVFYNITANAFKFTPENGFVAIKLYREAGENGAVVFSIADNGSIITAQQAEKIFENFYQIDATHSEGSGIGLALVKSMVTLHQGSIHVEINEEKHEKAFVVRLPITHVADKNIDDDMLSKIDSKQVLTELNNTFDIEESTEISEDQEIVLVIDDNYGIRNYVKTLLEPNYAVITAKSGVEGIQKAIQSVPNIIICDVTMPGMDGFEVCKKLKAETATSHIPIIMLTACSLDEQLAKGFSEGAEAYMTKPFKSELLLAQVESLLKNRKLIKMAYGENLHTTSQRVSSLDDDFMKKMLGYIDENMDNAELSVEDISDKMGMCRAQLYRKVKALTNYSPNELLRNRRLKKARQMLLTQKYTISDVCYQTGFTTPSYFSKCYSDYFGETPSTTLKNNDAT